MSKRLNKKTTVIDDLIAPDDDEDKFGLKQNLSNLGRRLRTKTKVQLIQKVVRQRQHKTHAAADKIIGAFSNRIKLKVGKISSSLRNKVKEIRVIPTGIGKNKYGNIEALIENSNKVARREMPSGTPFQVYTSLKFPSQTGDNFHVTTTKYTHKLYKEMFVQLVRRASELLQSSHEALLKDFQITFSFIEIPHGSGSATTSRERLSILNKQSVNRVVNDDNNCFWYALVMLVYANHGQIKQIKMGRKIRTTLAMELCSHCEMEWNKPVSFDEIPMVEEMLNANIMVVDIKQIPVLNTTARIYNSRMYKNCSVKSPTKY